MWPWICLWGSHCGMSELTYSQPARHYHQLSLPQRSTRKVTIFAQSQSYHWFYSWPLIIDPRFFSHFRFLADGLRSHGVAHKVDESSGSIGRRYARTDQIGIPFAVTIDFDTLSEPNSVTLRERDSLLQVRAPVRINSQPSLIMPFVPPLQSYCGKNYSVWPDHERGCGIQFSLGSMKIVCHCWTAMELSWHIFCGRQWSYL